MAATKGHMLVKVKFPSDRIGAIPTFSILSRTRLEVSVRAARDKGSGVKHDIWGAEGSEVVVRAKEKQIALSHGIQEHNLNVKCMTIVKWLGKNYFIRVEIQGDGKSPAKAQELQAQVQEKIKEALGAEVWSEKQDLVHFRTKK